MADHGVRPAALLYLLAAIQTIQRREEGAMKLITYGIIAGVVWYLWTRNEEVGAGAFGQSAGRRVGRKPGTKPGAGPGGECVCPSCGATVAHLWNVACYDTVCPVCGSLMER